MKTLTHRPSDRMKALIGGVLAFVIVLSGALFVASRARAAVNGEMHGFAWSDTIGWISLNCAEGGVPTGSGSTLAVTNVCASYDYKVSITGNVLSGQAWSDNVGWIDFGASACGSAGTLDEFTGKIHGWANVIAGNECVSLDADTIGSPFDYGLLYAPSSSTTVSVGSSTLPGNELSGFVWSTPNLGWVEFAYTTIAPVFEAPSVTLRLFDGGSGGTESTSATYASTGSPIVLSLHSSAMYVDSCFASASPSASDWNSGTTISLPSTYTGVMNPGTPGVYTYTITCDPTDPALSAISDTVTVTVTGTTAGVPALTFRATAIDGAPIAPSSSVTIDSGSRVTLSWTTNDVDNAPTCLGTSVPTYSGWNGTKASSATSSPVTYSYTTGPLTAAQAYTIRDCLPATGGAALPAQTVNVAIRAPWCEIVPVTVSVVQAPGSAVSVTQPFSVVWHGGPFVARTLTADASTTPFTASFTGSPTLTSPSSSAPLHVTGTMPGTSQGIAVSDTASSCTSAVLTITPPGTTSGGGTGRWLPWEEF